MRTFHLHTIDLVNHAHVEELAARYGYSVELTEPRDGPPESHGKPVIVDLDFIADTPSERSEFVQKYSRTPLKQVLSVFSYRLEDEDIRKLQANGVLFFPRIDDDTMSEFVRALAPDTPPEPNRERNIERFFGLQTRV